MPGLIGIPVLLACALLLLAAPAHAFDPPYESVAGTVMPDPRAWDDPVLMDTLFPSWEEDCVLGLGYREQKTYYHGTRALFTFTVRRDVWVSLLYYAADGRCWLALPAARVSPQQQISYSMILGGDEQGLSRVLLWDHEPARETLRQLCQESTPGLSHPGLLYQAWYPRTNLMESGLPWEPTEFRVYETPPSFAMTDIPAARAQLNSNYMVYAKDCYVEFDGRNNLGTDDWGSRGEWVITWGNPLGLEIQLPERYNFSNAVLRLYVEQNNPYGESPDSTLQLSVNGHEIHNLQSGSIQVGAKHVDYELGQYMYPGRNVIELSLDAFSTRDWYLQTAEVWIR